MIADAAQADAFANGQRQARESDRVALVTALNLPPETTWADALARVVPVAVAAVGCHGCALDGTRCWTQPGVMPWVHDYLGPDLMTPKPGAPECPGRVQKEQG